MILAGKNTRISLLYTQANRSSPWSSLSHSDAVDQALEFARKEFGANGTQAGRRWFYRFREELFRTTIDQYDGRLRSIPSIRHWCDIYFRDPKDATWFQLKKDSSLSQMS